jgi:hypothetical protein
MDSPPLTNGQVLEIAFLIRLEFHLTNSNGWMADAYAKRIAAQCGSVFKTRREIYRFLHQKPLYSYEDLDDDDYAFLLKIHQEGTKLA